jgi:hypothetical protein
MAELWELICHHTYRGVPGVVVDMSPSGASHGLVEGLDDGDFLKDGVTPGSGAVQFYKPGGRVRVPAKSSPWQSIVGIKSEVTIRRPRLSGTSLVLHSDSLAFSIIDDVPYVDFGASGAISPSTIGPNFYRMPSNQWCIVGFLHDGFNTIELHADGAVVSRISGAYGEVNPPGGAGVSIGNTLSGGSAFLNGEIDDVKIWRLNPRRFHQAFYARPMDAETAECWQRFQREIDESFRRHPECVAQIGAALKQAIANFARHSVAEGPAMQERLLQSAKNYNRLWVNGEIENEEMVQNFVDLLKSWEASGIDLQDSDMYAGLARSPCLRLILSEITVPDCDRQVKALLEAVVRRMTKT